VKEKPSLVKEEEMEATQVAIAKGDLICTEVIDCVVRMWFSSPTGDSSDSHIFDMWCRDHKQAVEIANRHNKAWGINHFHLDEI
jgi:hypothetical protein